MTPPSRISTNTITAPSLSEPPDTTTQRPHTNIRPRSLFLAPNLTHNDQTPASPQPPPEISAVDQFKTMFDYHHKYKNRYHQPDRAEAKLSTTNLKSNHPWGDELSQTKSPSTFRLYYQNVNGMQIDDQGGDFTAICSTIHRLGCDLVGFCEIKLDVSKYQVKKSISSSLHSQFRNNKVAATTSTIPFDGYYKPGGTMTICVDHHTSRFQNKFEDSLGRWSTISLNGKNG